MVNRWQRYGHMYRLMVVGSLLSITVMGAWSCKSAPPPEPEPELPEVTLKPIEEPSALESIHCAIASDSPTLALMHVASEMGYFEKEGLEIQITKVTPSTSPKQLSLLNLLLQEDIDCVSQTLDGYLRTQDGQLFQTAVIASLYTSTGADGLVVTDPIMSIEDLLDQPIGGDRHHPGILLTYQALRQLGYSPDDVMIKPIDLVEEAEEVTDTEEETKVGEAEEVTDAEEETKVGEAGEENSQDVTDAAVEDSEAEVQKDPDTDGPDTDSVDSLNETTEPLVRPSFADVFQREGVVAIAASKPILDQIAADTGGQILLTSVEFEDLLMGTLIVEQADLKRDSDRYRGLLRGVYQAIALYNSDRPKFLQVAAAHYGQSPQALEQKLHGISYTSYSDLQRIIGAGASTGSLFQTFTDLNAIHQDLELQNGPLFYDDHIDNRLIPNLFDL